MSSTTTTTSSSLAAMAAKFKIRKGAPLPLLLDSFPVPPNHLPSPIGRPPTSPLPPLPPSSSRPTPATVITASSPPSSPPAKSKSRKSKSRMDATLSTIDTRAESPDIKDLLPPKSSRKNDYDWGRSLAKMDGSWDVEDVLRDEGTQDLEYNSDSSIDLHTPLPHIMLREGLLSPHSKALPPPPFSLSRTPSPTPPVPQTLSSKTSRASLASTSSNKDFEKRKIRHRDGKLLRDGVGLTTGLGWSDSDDEDQVLPLARRVSALSVRSSNSSRSSAYSSSIRSAPPSSSLSHSTSYASSTNSHSSVQSSTSRSSSRGYSAFTTTTPLAKKTRHHAPSTLTRKSLPSIGENSQSQAPPPFDPDLGRSVVDELGYLSKELDNSEVRSRSSKSSSNGSSRVESRYAGEGFNFSLPRSSSANSISKVSISTKSSMSSIGSGSIGGGGERARTVSESSSGRRVGMIIGGGIKRSQTDPTISPTSSSSRSLRSPSSSISHGSLISPAPSISATLTTPISPMVASDERSRTPTPSSAADGTTPSSSNQSLAFPLTPSASTEFTGQGQSGLAVYGGGRLRTISGASSGGSAVHLPSVGVSTSETSGTAKKRTIMTPAAAISKSYMSRSVSGAPPSAPPASVTVAEQGSRSRATSLKGGLPTPSPSISSKASLSQSTSSSKLHPIPHSTSSSTQRSGALHPLNNTPTTPTTPVSNTPAHSYRLGGAPPKLSSSTSSRSLSSQLQQSRSVSSPIVPPKSLSSSTNIATPPATPQASRTGTGMSYRSTSRASRLLLPRKSLGALFGGGSSSSSAGVGAGGVNRL